MTGPKMRERPMWRLSDPVSVMEPHEVILTNEQVASSAVWISPAGNAVVRWHLLDETGRQHTTLFAFRCMNRVEVAP